MLNFARPCLCKQLMRPFSTSLSCALCSRLRAQRDEVPDHFIRVVVADVRPSLR